MNDIQILKHRATRQFRHNDDNSPNAFCPDDGFVIAYDKDIIDRGFLVLQRKLEEAEDSYESEVKILDGIIDAHVGTITALEAKLEAARHDIERLVKFAESREAKLENDHE